MDALAQKITAFIRQGANTDDAEFNALACALFTYQYGRNTPYRLLCESYGILPEAVRRWQDIPAVPSLAFKSFELSCVLPGQAAAVFHSSGTTGPSTSRHFFDLTALALYETSLRQGFHDAIPHCPPTLWALMPPPETAPHSSLSHMLGALGAQRFFWDDDAALATALAENTQSVALFGTAFAFVQFLDNTNFPCPLPPGSLLIETGGFKGRTREVPRDEFYSLLTSRFAVPLEACFSEYGMSEMASQFYGRGLDPLKRGPHWVRTRCIDPVTGEDAAPGTPGALRHYDLANFNSVLALQTQDLGTLTGDGFLLQGRAPDAEVRGCSLTVEELWTSK